MSTLPNSERCPYCGGTKFNILPRKQAAQWRTLAYYRCGDCGTTFDPPSAKAVRPHIGDLIVRERGITKDFVITLVGASSAQETHCASRTDAITLATRAANGLRANVWETGDGLTFDLIAGYGV